VVYHDECFELCGSVWTEAIRLFRKEVKKFVSSFVELLNEKCT